VEYDECGVECGEECDECGGECGVEYDECGGECGVEYDESVRQRIHPLTTKSQMTFLQELRDVFIMSLVIILLVGAVIL